MTGQRRNIFMFSGQGSQYYQMGRALYEQGGKFAKRMRHMDQIVQDLGCNSVVTALYGEQSKAMPFDDLILSHPAIFMVEYALAESVMEMGVEPDMTLGVSLGSVAAAVVAGSLRMEEALSWVVLHARRIVEHCELGGMIGVLATPLLHNEPALQSTSAIAAENGPSHWVLSAPANELAGIEDFLKSRDVPFGRLPVRYPFHSSWMIVDQARASSPLPEPAYGLPRMPVACCVKGDIHTHLPVDYFAQAMGEPIRFERAIREIEAQAGDNQYNYLDLGPSGTLATLLKYLLPADAASRIQSSLSPYGRDLANLASLRAQCSNEVIA